MWHGSGERHGALHEWKSFEETFPVTVEASRGFGSLERERFWRSVSKNPWQRIGLWTSQALATLQPAATGLLEADGTGCPATILKRVSHLQGASPRDVSLRSLPFATLRGVKGSRFLVGHNQNASGVGC